MLVHRGNTVETAIKIDLPNGMLMDNVEYLIESTLNQIFGGRDGDYMVCSSEIKLTPSGKKYKLLLIEDIDEDKHHMFFELITKKDML